MESKGLRRYDTSSDGSKSGRGEREADDEVASLSKPIAARDDRSAVKLDEIAYQGEAHSHAALRPADGIFSLCEQLENRIDPLRSDSDVIVDDTEHGIVSFALQRYGHMTALDRVFQGVRQDVRHDLVGAHRIGVRRQRFIRLPHLDADLMASREFRERFQTPFNDLREIAWLTLEHDLPRNDA